MVVGVSLLTLALLDQKGYTFASQKPVVEEAFLLQVDITVVKIVSLDFELPTLHTNVVLVAVRSWQR